MFTRQIGGGLLTASGLAGAVLLDRTLPHDPSNLVLILGWGGVIAMVVVGLILVYWPEKKPTMTDDKKAPPVNGPTPAISMRGVKHGLVQWVNFKGFEQAVDADGGEHIAIIENNIESPPKKDETPEKED